MLNGDIPNENCSDYLKLSDLIDEHFYYLCSPKRINNTPFLLSRHIKPKIKNRKTEKIVGYGPKVERFIIKSYFDIKETLLIISCLYKRLNDPVMLIFDDLATSGLTDNYNREYTERLGDAQESNLKFRIFLFSRAWRTLRSLPESFK